jgi:prepilin-type processing-associated H-X9-DG protein
MFTSSRCFLAERRGKRATGFTLLELVLVTAIVATLFSLLLPAIQRVRSKRDQVGCAQNLKKLGIAVYQYHDHFRMLPPGALGPKPNTDNFVFANYQHASCLVYLLPYLDDGHVYRRLVTNLDPNYPPDYGKAQSAWWVNDWIASQKRFVQFQCPSDTTLYDRVSLGAFVLQNPFGSTLFGLYYPPPSADAPGRTNYAGVAGAHGKDAALVDFNTCPADFPAGGANLAKYEGLFTNRSRNAFTHVPDGISNTLLLGEGIGGNIQAGNPRDSAWTWMGIGSVCTKFGLGQAGYPYGNSKFGASWTNFSSFHPNGVNFCMADGSVRLIRFGATTQRLPNCSTDWFILQALAGFRDGAWGGD